MNPDATEPRHYSSKSRLKIPFYIQKYSGLSTCHCGADSCVLVCHHPQRLKRHQFFLSVLEGFLPHLHLSLNKHGLVLIFFNQGAFPPTRLQGPTLAKLMYQTRYEWICNTEEDLEYV